MENNFFYQSSNDFSFLDEFLEDDLNLLKKCIRNLLESTFIVEELQPELFSFITYASNENYIASVLNLFGFDLLVDKQLRFAMLIQNTEDLDIIGLKKINLMYFKKHQMFTLLLLWMIYLQKDNNGKAINIKISEIYEYGKLFGHSFKKSDLKNDLRMFRKFNLINFPKDKFEELRLYPTLQFALDKNELINLVSELQEDFKEEC